MSTTRNVLKVFENIEMEEGVGSRVRRSIGTSGLRNFHPFLMLDHFKVSKGAGFPNHPHRGQATVTYMLEGSFEHGDNFGHKGVINQGDVQWMVAGKGVIHSEMPVQKPGDPTPTGLQLWIDLPKDEKFCAPEYQELTDKDLPRAYPQGESGPVEIKIISGDSHGVSSPIRQRGGCWYFDIKLKSKGANVFQPLPKGWNALAYILSGSLKTKDNKILNKFHTITLSNNDEEDGLYVESNEEEEARLILIAGKPLDQPCIQWGPFVLTSEEEIQQAFIDYRLGRNGFERP